MGRKPKKLSTIMKRSMGITPKAEKMFSAPKKRRKKKDECFISTVCFGENALETEKFRRWRDNSLVNYKLGRFFIKWYYKYGSEISSFLKKVKILKYITKFFLKRIANLLN